jgi:serine/threonine protein kinase
MERLCAPYLSLHDHLSSTHILRSTDWTLHAIHHVLQMLNTYFYPRKIIHGDLHYHNIFVHEHLGHFMHAPAPVKFIDFGRTVSLKDKFSDADIRTLMSIDVLALLRAACRQCQATTDVDRHRARHHQSQKIHEMLTGFLDHHRMVSMKKLKDMAPQVRSPHARHCEQCSGVYDWVDALLRHPMFPNKEGRSNVLSFLDITAG